MNISSRLRSTRASLILGVVALLVITVGFVAVLAVLVQRAEDKDPALTAYAHGRAVPVPPFRYCTVRMTDCRMGDTVDLVVPSGYPVQLSLPDEVASAPWVLSPIYQRDDGTRFTKQIDYRSSERRERALTIDSVLESGARLIGVEFWVDIYGIDQDGKEVKIPHAFWSINTPAQE